MTITPELFYALLRLPELSPDRLRRVELMARELHAENEARMLRKRLAAGLRTGTGNGGGEYHPPALRIVRGGGGKVG